MLDTDNFSQIATMLDTDVRVLSVEDSPRDANLLSAILDERRTGLPYLHFEIANVTSIAAAKQRLQQDACFDVIVLDLSLPDSQGLTTLASMLSICEDIPVIVYTGNRNLEYAAQAVRLGAQDYLIKGSTNGALMARAIRYALERKAMQKSIEQLRLREQADRELQALLDLAASATPLIATRLYGDVALEDDARELFEDLVEAYAAVVKTALEKRLYKVDADISGELRTMARTIGNASASSRDIIAIHSAALRMRKDTDLAEYEAMLEESRYILLELMGHLASYYRMYARGVMRISSMAKAAEMEN